MSSVVSEDLHEDPLDCLLYMRMISSMKGKNADLSFVCRRCRMCAVV